MSKTNSDQIAAACLSVRDETGFEDGAEVRTARLHEMLGLEPEPTREKGESDKAFIRRAKRHDLAAITPVKRLRDRLLKVHKVDLQATGRGVYRVTPRRDQAERGIRHAVLGARRAMRDGLAIAEHVDVSRLTGEEARRRDAALLTGKAYLQMLGGRTHAQRLDAARAGQKDSASNLSATAEAARE